MTTSAIETGPFAGLRRGHYGTILADPAWTFTTRSDGGKGRSPEEHYRCMTLDEIKALPVPEIAAKDCVLLLWVIDTHLEMAFDVIREWGFAYKTRGFEWIKLNQSAREKKLLAGDPEAYFTGMGFWSRANGEDVLLCTRGKPKRRPEGASVRRLIVSPRREHSRKPDEIIDRVEALTYGPYCELFSRTWRPGWDLMGDEVGKFVRGRDRLAMVDDLLYDDVEDLI